MATDAIVQLISVSKSYDGKPVIEDLDLEIKRGEFVCFLGPSGCGKTTTLRMIAGLEETNSGTVMVDGRDVTHVPAHRRPVSTVFQSYALFPHMTVLDNVAYGPRRHGQSKAAARKRAREMIELVGLQDFADRLPSQLSGGQRQRVAVARSVANEPKVLLLDEPLGALDLKLRRRMQLEFRRLHRDLGLTFVYVTHDQDEALVMSDRIVVMNDGKIEQIGTGEEIYKSPKTAFVGDFVGSGNLLDAMVVAAGSGGSGVGAASEGPQLALGGGRVRGWSVDPAAHLVGQEVRVVVRPEEVAVSRGELAANESRNVLTACVEDIFFTGNSSVAVCWLDDGQRIEARAANGGLAGISPGTPVTLSWDAENTRVVLGD